MFIRFLNICFLIVLVVCVASCASSRKSIYFPDQRDTTLLVTSLVPEAYIQSNDLMSITVSSLNAEATSFFNAPNNTGITTTNSNTSMTTAYGYLVDVDGNIQFPMLGNIKAAGLTKKQLKENISKTLIDKKLLIDPVVAVRYLNFKVTVLGEVQHPSVINVPSEKISLLEALGLAGDLTIWGKRDNVLLIREELDQKTTKRIDLNSGDLFKSPYYYLKPNDVLYVEPNKNKIRNANSGSTWLVPIITGLLSLGIILGSRN